MLEFPLVDHHGSNACSLLRRISHLLDFNTGPWVAGGIIRRILTRSEHGDHDIDIFFASQQQRIELAPKIREIELMWREQKGASLVVNPFVVNHSVNTTGLAFDRSDEFSPLQFVSSHYYNGIEELLRDIDFTICQMSSDGKTIRCSAEALDDLRDRRLRISSTSSVRVNTRIFRYFTYGFEPDESVMTIAQNLPKSSYYGVDDNYIGFEEVIKELIGENLATQLTLGKMKDVMIERHNGIGVAYLYGFPFPAPMGYLYLNCKDMRNDIRMKLKPLWDANDLGPCDYMKRPEISIHRFFDEYRRAYAEEE